MGNKKMSVYVLTKLKMIFSLFIFISDWVLSRLFDWLIGGVLLDLPIQSSTSVGELTFFADSHLTSFSTIIPVNTLSPVGNAQIVWDLNRVTSCIIMGNFASKTQEKEAIWIVVHHVVVDGREVIGTMVRNESKWFWTSYVLDRDICAPHTVQLLQTFCLSVDCNFMLVSAEYLFTNM